MSLNFRFAAIISVLVILLWFVLQTFVFSTDLNKFGIKTSNSSLRGDGYNPKNHTAAGFEAFEELKELKAKEKKEREERDKKFKTHQEPSVIANTDSTLLVASNLSTQQVPQSTPLQQLQVKQASVTEQILRLQISQTQASQQAIQAQPTQASPQASQVQQSQLVRQRAQQTSRSNTSQSVTSTTDVITFDQARLNGQAKQPSPSQPKPDPTSTNIRAIDAVLSVENSVNCQDNYVAGVFFKENSVSMRSRSLSGLDALIQEHRNCLNSVFLIKNVVSDELALMLDQRRQDEVKYYLLQRSVDKSAIKLDQ